MANELVEPVRLPINNLINVVTTRRRGLEMALKLGFSLPDATKIAVVISELARNITLYTEGGTITLIPYTGERKGIKIIAQDKGPGIEDVNRVLAGGYTTSKGLGMGISGSKKIMDEFEIQTVIGGGTTIKGTKWLD
ncbi:MAG: anti-sigma regulatory factor [Anaerolineae bacterium]|nr:anti-sigma regulatory factor [Anaerolineae bacterium]